MLFFLWPGNAVTLQSFFSRIYLILKSSPPSHLFPAFSFKLSPFIHHFFESSAPPDPSPKVLCYGLPWFKFFSFSSHHHFAAQPLAIGCPVRFFQSSPITLFFCGSPHDVCCDLFGFFFPLSHSFFMCFRHIASLSCLGRTFNFFLNKPCPPRLDLNNSPPPSNQNPPWYFYPQTSRLKLSNPVRSLSF